MDAPVTVACVQVEPAIFDRAATLDRLAERTAEAAGAGAGLVVFPETFVPAYPSSAWAKALAGWGDPGAKEAFALLHRESLELPGPDADRLAATAREHGVWLVVGVTSSTRSGRGRSTTPSSTTRPRASSRSTTASSCRRTTSGSSGARATGAACGQSRARSAASAG